MSQPSAIIHFTQLIGVVVTDPAAGTAPHWVNLWANGGLISSPMNTAGTNGTADLFFSGTLQQINAFLAGVIYVPTGTGPHNVNVAYSNFKTKTDTLITVP